MQADCLEPQRAAIKPSIPSTAPAAIGTCVAIANPELVAEGPAAVLEGIYTTEPDVSTNDILPS